MNHTPIQKNKIHKSNVQKSKIQKVNIQKSKIQKRKRASLMSHLKILPKIVRIHGIHQFTGQVHLLFLMGMETRVLLQAQRWIQSPRNGFQTVLLLSACSVGHLSNPLFVAGTTVVSVEEYFVDDVLLEDVCYL
jgi:hypothetical protein